MTRYSLAVNIASGGNGQASHREPDAKRTSGDSLTDDVYLSWEATAVKTKAQLRASVARILQMLDSGGYGLT